MSLEDNTFVYEKLLIWAKLLFRFGREEDCAAFVEKVAHFAYMNHVGRLSDGALDNLLMEIGKSAVVVRQTPTRTQQEDNRRKTLHVVSTVFSVGGHTRVLSKWIRDDQGSNHGLVLTRNSNQIPSFLSDIIKSTGAEVFHLDLSLSIIERAQLLRDIAITYDRVVLHHHPDDAVPSVAFAVPGGPPVVMFNHAHFWFSLGSSVSDLILNTMPYFGHLTKLCRFPQKQGILRGPFNLNDVAYTEVDKSAAKQAIGIQPSTPVAMTIASEGYFDPIDGYDFFVTVERLLRDHPTLVIIMVGIAVGSRVVPRCISSHPRLLLPGKVDDPSPYYHAADLCLESFPWPSLGATVEACLIGAALPVLTYGESECVLRIRSKQVVRLVPPAATENAYRKQIVSFLADLPRSRRMAAILRRSFLRRQNDFSRQFPELNRQIDDLIHAPRCIPTTKCSREHDNYLLASPSPIRIDRTLFRLLPLPLAIFAHSHAIACGHLSIRGYMMRAIVWYRKKCETEKA